MGACNLKESRSLGQNPLLRSQKTLEKSVFASGRGVFTGKDVSLRLVPAPVGTGIVFQRVDLPEKPTLPAILSSVQSTPRCTVLGNNTLSIQTVEHLLAALYAYELTNLVIELSGPEVPILDGGSSRFVEMIEEAGSVNQEAFKPVLSLKTPVSWSSGDVHLVALPCDELKITYTLHYPSSSVIGTQFYSTAITPEIFKKEIAPCRTFSVYEEIISMIEKGLLDVRGGSVENAVIIRDGKILNEEGLHFPEEMARHKVLDVLGDLSLIAEPFVAHVIAVRSGHFSNHAFAKVLFNHLQRENS